MIYIFTFNFYIQTSCVLDRIFCGVCRWMTCCSKTDVTFSSSATNDWCLFLNLNWSLWSHPDRLVFCPGTPYFILVSLYLSPLLLSVIWTQTCFFITSVYFRSSSPLLTVWPAAVGYNLGYNEMMAVFFVSSQIWRQSVWQISLNRIRIRWLDFGGDLDGGLNFLDICSWNWWQMERRCR